MRSPLGYCNVGRCRKWVREKDRWPRRCPQHASVPMQMSEMIGRELRRVYFKAAKVMEQMEGRWLKFHEAWRGR